MIKRWVRLDGASSIPLGLVTPGFLTGVRVEEVRENVIGYPGDGSIHDIEQQEQLTLNSGLSLRFLLTGLVRCFHLFAGAFPEVRGDRLQHICYFCFPPYILVAVRTSKISTPSQEGDGNRVLRPPPNRVGGVLTAAPKGPQKSFIHAPDNH